MLDRLGTGPDSRLELHQQQATWPIEAEGSPAEEALLNLSVNARDAIEGAGPSHLIVPAGRAPDSGAASARISSK